METTIQNRMKLIRQAAAGDLRYQKCNGEFLKAEQAFLEMIPELTESQQDLLWRFVNLSNEVDECLLEIAVNIWHCNRKETLFHTISTLLA